jgi:hypothetical protein
MITDPDNPSDWLLLARDRLEKADAISSGSGHHGPELNFFMRRQSVTSRDT